MATVAVVLNTNQSCQRFGCATLFDGIPVFLIGNMAKIWKIRLRHAWFGHLRNMRRPISHTV